MATKTHDRIGGIFWLMVGTFTTIHGYSLGLGRMRHPGPGFIFFLAGLGLTVLSVINLGETFIGKPDEGGDKEGPSIWQGIQWQKILFVLVVLSAYAYFFSCAGFTLSTFLLMGLLYKGVEPTKWWIAIVSSLITVLFSYVVFVKWLEVPFPTGFLGF